jgi:hypothetical protein
MRFVGGGPDGGFINVNAFRSPAESEGGVAETDPA